VRLLEGNHKSVHTYIDVLTHETPVHTTNETNRDSVAYRLLFNVGGVTNNHTDGTRSCRVEKSIVEKACKIANSPSSQLINSLEKLEPEDGAEGTREEDAI
jgi:hypothetical protein